MRQMKDELVQRIEQGDNQLRDDMRQMKGELVQRIEQGDNQLRDDMRQMKEELRGEIRQHGVELAAMRNDIVGLRVDVSRVLYLVEEQNARNRIVLEGLSGLAARQDRVERRMDAVEETVRDLASSRRP